MSPSEKIRALLNERGIEWKSGAFGDPRITYYKSNGVEWCVIEHDDGRLVVNMGINVTPEQAIAATVGNGTDLSKRLREVTGLRSFAELFGFDWTDGSDWYWHDVACAMADAIDATAGTAMTLDEATEYAEQFMGDYAKVLLESTLYVERDEPTDQHAFDVAERKEAQMARDLAEALATAGTDYRIQFAPTLDRPPETMVGETVYDSEGNAIGWIANATVGVGTCQIETTESWLPAERYHRCKHCGAFFAVLDASHDIPPRVCPNCGRRIIEEVTE